MMICIEKKNYLDEPDVMQKGWKKNEKCSLNVNKVFELQHCINIRKKHLKPIDPKKEPIYITKDGCALVVVDVRTVKELLQGQGWNLNCKLTEEWVAWKKWHSIESN